MRGMVLSLLLAGCATAPVVPPAPPRTLSLDEARAQVKAVVDAQYAALDRGDFEAWAAPIAGDAFYFGVRADEALPSRAATVEAWKRAVGPRLANGGKLAVRSTALSIGVSADGRAAWVSDEIELTFSSGDDEQKETQRLTEVLGESEGQWWVLAQHWSIGVPNDLSLDPARAGALPKLHEVIESIAPGAQSVADEFKRVTKKPSELLTTLSDRSDTFVIGTAPDETIVGSTKVRELLGRQLNQLGLRILRAGGVRAGVTPNGRVGWVASNIILSAMPAVGQAPVRVPTRALLVYLNEGGLWKLVQCHFSTVEPPQQ